MDEKEFKTALVGSKDKGEKIFNPIREMILKLYKGFRNIKGPDRRDIEAKYSDLSNMDYSGIIMDAES